MVGKLVGDLALGKFALGKRSWYQIERILQCRRRQTQKEELRNLIFIDQLAFGKPFLSRYLPHIV